MRLPPVLGVAPVVHVAHEEDRRCAPLLGAQRLAPLPGGLRGDHPLEGARRIVDPGLALEREHDAAAQVLQPIVVPAQPGLDDAEPREDHVARGRGRAAHVDRRPPVARRARTSGPRDGQRVGLAEPEPDEVEALIEGASVPGRLEPQVGESPANPVRRPVQIGRAGQPATHRVVRQGVQVPGQPLGGDRAEVGRLARFGAGREHGHHDRGERPESHVADHVISPL